MEKNLSELVGQLIFKFTLGNYTTYSNDIILTTWKFAIEMLWQKYSCCKNVPICFNKFIIFRN